MRTLAIAAALLAATAAPVLADSTFTADDNTLYRIQSDYFGYTFSVDMLNNNAGNRVHLDATAGVPTQLWHIHRNGDGTYSFSTGYNGSCRRLDLAIHPGGITEVILNPSNGNSTQHWTLAGGDGTNHWRFINAGISSDQGMDAVTKASDNDAVVQMAPLKSVSSQFFEISGVVRSNDNHSCDN